MRSSRIAGQAGTRPAAARSAGDSPLTASPLPSCRGGGDPCLSRGGSRRVRALVDAALAAGPLGLAQRELLHLAGRRLGQRAEGDGVRALVVGQAVAAERDQL